MCGRYAVTSAPEAIRALFGYPEQPNFPPRYNVAPTQPIAIVRLIDGKREFALVRWGLLPSWVMDKPAFSAAVKRRRCLVPADGFYEWKAVGPGKQPYYVRAKSGAPLAFAGLWETWIGPNGEEMETATIVTTRANRPLADIHERMPVIVAPDAFNLWLDCANVDAETAAALIAPAPDDLLEAYEVSTAVNRTANDNPKLIERDLTPIGTEAVPERAAAPRRTVRAKKDDGQGVLF